jgi:hypothetical protein
MGAQNLFGVDRVILNQSKLYNAFQILDLRGELDCIDGIAICEPQCSHDLALADSGIVEAFNAALRKYYHVMAPK